VSPAGQPTAATATAPASIPPAILGVDLGASGVRVGKVRAGSLGRVTSSPISGRERAEVVAGEVYRAIDGVFDDEVAGIGCGVPSVVDVDRGIVYNVENIPAWREVPLKDELETRYGVPVYVNNDANAFAVGELYFGHGRGYRNLVGVTLGTGLGAGIIIDGRLYNGSNCGAGEIGAIPYRDHTIEHYCASSFFHEQAGMDGEAVFRRALAGDPQARQLFRRYGDSLGYALLVVLYAYDPEMVVLGGSISQALPFFEPAMRERLRTYSYPHSLQRLRLVRSEVEHVAVLGAAALYLDAQLPSEPAEGAGGNPARSLAADA
jgi:glucokinase